MKRIIGVLVSLMMIFALSTCGNRVEQEDLKEISTVETTQSEEEQNITTQGTKILVVYFSCTGTMERVAEYVTEILGADLYEIIPEEPYTEADLAYYTNGRADQEQNDPDIRPAEKLELSI